MAKETTGGQTDVGLTELPDIPNRPPINEEEQHQVMKDAVGRRGGLGYGEELTAVPSDQPPPPGSWQKEGQMAAGSGTQYNIYSRQPQHIDFTDDEDQGAPGPAASKSPAAKGAPSAQTPQPGSDALKDVDKNFSPAHGPGNTVVKCAVGFLKGFVEGFFSGLLIGLALGFVAAFSPIAAAIAGGALLAYGVYQVVTHIHEIINAPPEKKAEMIGNLIGGAIGGKLGYKGGLGLGGKAKGWVKSIGKAPPEAPSRAPVVRKGPIPDEEPQNLQQKLLMDEARAGEAAGENQPIQGGPDRPLGDAPRLVDNHGGKESDWVKMKGPNHDSVPYTDENGVTQDANTEVHYFKNTDTGQTVEWKFKRQ
jgi:hypothetical protein